MESGWANINLNILFHKLILQVEVRSIIINDRDLFDVCIIHSYRFCSNMVFLFSLLQLKDWNMYLFCCNDQPSFSMTDLFQILITNYYSQSFLFCCETYLGFFFFFF